MVGQRRIRQGDISAYAVAIPEELRQLRSTVEQLALSLTPPAAPYCPTLREFAPRFMSEFVRANRQKPRGIQSKDSILRVHLLPMFGDRRLDSFEDVDIQRLKTELTDRSRKTVNNVLTVLSKMLKIAVKWRIIKQVPVQIELFQVDLPRVAFYEFDQYESLIRAAELVDVRTLTMVLLGGDAGLRMGEITALKWSDVDWRHDLLHVNQSQSQGKLTTTKSGRARNVPVTQKLRATLLTLRRSASEQSPRVLARDDGSEVTEQTLRSWLAKAQRIAGLKANGGLHILRHTFCSHLAMRGAPVVAIRELAGHSSLRTTLRYMHLAPSEKRRAIELLDSARYAAKPEVTNAKAKNNEPQKP